MVAGRHFFLSFHHQSAGFWTLRYASSAHKNKNNKNNNKRHAVRDDDESCFFSFFFFGFIFRARIDLCLSSRARARIACGFRFGQPPLAFHMRTSKTRADGMHRALFFSLTRAPHNAVKLSTSKPASAVTRLAPSFGRYAIRRGDNCLFLFLDIFFLLRVLVNSARSQYRVARFQRTLTTTLLRFHKRSSAMNTVSIRPVRTPAIPIYNSSASTCTSTKPPAVDTFRERA